MLKSLRIIVASLVLSSSAAFAENAIRDSHGVPTLVGLQNGSTFVLLMFRVSPDGGMFISTSNILNIAGSTSTVFQGNNFTVNYGTVPFAIFGTTAIVVHPPGGAGASFSVVYPTQPIVSAQQFSSWLAGVYYSSGTFQVAFSTRPDITAFQGNNYVVNYGSVPFSVFTATPMPVKIEASSIAVPADIQAILDNVRLRIAQDISSGTWQVAIGTSASVVGPGGGSVPTVSTLTIIAAGIQAIPISSTQTLPISGKVETADTKSSTAPAEVSGNVMVVPDLSRTIPFSRVITTDLSYGSTDTIVFSATNVWTDSFSLGFTTHGTGVTLEYNGIVISSFNVASFLNDVQRTNAVEGGGGGGWERHETSATNSTLHWHGGIPPMFFPLITLKVRYEAGGGVGTKTVDGFQIFYRSTSTTPSGP